MVARIDPATTYTILVNLGEISYPQSYLTSTTSHADIVTDSCAIAPPTGEITIPKSFMGTRPLPELLATDRLVSQASRGMRVKGVWDVNNAAYVRGCVSSIRTAFVQTVEWLKTLGIDYLTLAPWTFGQITSTGQYRIGNPSEQMSSTIIDTDLRWAVMEAKAHGVKVHWLNQVGAICRNGFVPCDVMPYESITAQSVAQFMGAYRVFMLNRAALLDSIGVDVMQVGCICYFPTWTDDAIGRVYLDSLQALIPEIKRIYRGKLRMGWNSALGRYPEILNNIDYIEHGTWSNKPPEEYNSASVEDLSCEFYDRWECGFKRCNPEFTAKLATIPAIWNLGQASHGKTTRGTYEETFCTATVDPGPEDIAGCVQRSVKTDLSIQANVIQAQLRAFQNQTVVPVFAFEFGDFWPVDKIDPTTSFPNIAYSPRNKPAEAVLKHWFRR